MPKVSIIVPVYNTAAFLAECVDSVLRQTFSDFEVWLIDDGSTDGSAALCDRYARDDPRVHVLHQKNGGLSAARNAGLERAAGQYIYFLDSDDYILPTLLETTVRGISRGYDAVFFSYFIRREVGMWPARNPALGSWDLHSEQERLEFLRCHLLLPDLPWQVWNILYDRRAIERKGLRFADNRLIFAEDLYFNTCFCAHAERILSIPDRLHVYRYRADSLSGNYGSDLAHTTLYLGKMSRNARFVQQWMEGTGDCDAILDHFYLIHYLFVRHELYRCDRLFTGLGAETMRQMLQKDLRESGQEAYFAESIRQMRRHRRELKNIGSAFSNFRELHLAEYVINGGTARFRAVRALLHTATFIRHVPERLRRAAGGSETNMPPAR